MGRWFIVSQDNDSYKPNEISNKPYNNNQTIEALPSNVLLFISPVGNASIV